LGDKQLCAQWGIRSGTQSSKYIPALIEFLNGPNWDAVALSYHK